MNNDNKLKAILKNIVDKCDGINFYRIEIDGPMANIRKSGREYIIEVENNGSIISVIDIHSVSFDDDIYFATFEYDGGEYGVNIMKDMSPDEIMKELA